MSRPVGAYLDLPYEQTMENIDALRAMPFTNLGVMVQDATSRFRWTEQECEQLRAELPCVDLQAVAWPLPKATVMIREADQLLELGYALGNPVPILDREFNWTKKHVSGYSSLGAADETLVEFYAVQGHTFDISTFPFHSDVDGSPGTEFCRLLRVQAYAVVNRAGMDKVRYGDALGPSRIHELVERRAKDYRHKLAYDLAAYDQPKGETYEWMVTAYGNAQRSRTDPDCRPYGQPNPPFYWSVKQILRNSYALPNIIELTKDGYCP